MSFVSNVVQLHKQADRFNMNEVNTKLLWATVSARSLLFIKLDL
jgi:hypothetical protein